MASFSGSTLTRKWSSSSSSLSLWLLLSTPPPPFPEKKKTNVEREIHREWEFHRFLSYIRNLLNTKMEKYLGVVYSSCDESQQHSPQTNRQTFLFHPNIKLHTHYNYTELVELCYEKLRNDLLDEFWVWVQTCPTNVLSVVFIAKVHIDAEKIHCKMSAIRHCSSNRSEE